MGMQHAALATDGQRRPIDFTQRLWSSSDSGWAGLPLERHHVGPRGCLRDFAVPEVLLGVCVAGGAEVEVGGEDRVVLSPGRFILLDRGAAQRSIAWRGDRETLYIGFGKAQMKRLLPAAAEGGEAHVRPQFGVADTQVLRLAQCMADEARAGSPSGPMFAQALSVALATHVLARYGAPPPPQRRARQTFGAALRSRLEQYVDAHLARNVTLVELAAVADLSPHYFLQVFRNTFGTTPHSYLLRERVQRARRMLDTEQASLCDIALALGFADQSHFTSTFRRIAGVTPAQYRRGAGSSP